MIGLIWLLGHGEELNSSQCPNFTEANYDKQIHLDTEIVKMMYLHSNM